MFVFIKSSLLPITFDALEWIWAVWKAVAWNRSLIKNKYNILRISVQSVWKISLKYEMWGKYFSVSSGHCRPVLPAPAAPDVKIFIERFLRRPLWAAWITNGEAGPGRLNQFAPSTINQPTRIKIWPVGLSCQLKCEVTRILVRGLGVRMHCA